MATQISKSASVPSDSELRGKLVKERNALEKLLKGRDWVLYREGQTYVAENTLVAPKDGTIVFKFTANYQSTKPGGDAKQQLHEILWNSTYEESDPDVEEKNFVYTSEDETLRVKYLREKFPWPCEKREYITAFAREFTDLGSIVWGTPTEYGIPPQKKVVRGNESFLCIVEGLSSDQSKCKMTCVYTYNGGGWIPQWMIKLGITDMLNTFVGIQELL